MTTPTELDFETLLTEQKLTMHRLQNVLSNYQKKGKEQFTAVKTQLRIDDLRNLLATGTRLHVRLTTHEDADDDHEYFKDQEFETAQNQFDEQLDTLSELLATQTPTPSDSESKVNETSIGTGKVQSTMTLPKIQIPTFSGNPNEWIKFRDLFSALVIQCEHITPAQRLHYLKAAVTGDASLLIDNITISDENFESAWKILKDEFDNPRALIHEYIKAFAELPTMRTENHTELKHLRDVVNASITALKNLKRPVHKWDDWLVYVIYQKFSPRTKQEWNLSLGADTDPPTYNEIKEFMTGRIRGLTEKSHNDNSSRATMKPAHPPYNKNTANVHTVNTNSCVVCSNLHPVWRCNNFRKLDIDSRFKCAQNNKLCFNCLRAGHLTNNCPSQTRCSKCQRKHHSLLHRELRTGSDNSRPDYSSDNQTGGRTQNSRTEKGVGGNIGGGTPNPPPGFQPLTQTSNSFQAPPVPSNGTSCHTTAGIPVNVILPTAWVLLRTKEGRSVKARALLDQGSLYSFVSETVAQMLHTTRHKTELHVTGFGELYSGTVRNQLSLSIEPCNGQGPSLPMTAYVFSKITSYTASRTQSIGHWPHLSNLPLADPNPDPCEKIHVLIGADLYGYLLLNEIRQGPWGSPIGQLTIFGWILSGPTSNEASNSTSCNQVSVLNCVSVPELRDSLLQKFWELEEINVKIPLSEEDRKCEEHFQNTHSRSQEGRYIVKLPFKDATPIDIGSSIHTASKMYDKLERRLNQNSDLASQYHTFLGEYNAMDHMRRVDHPSSTPYEPVYIPHQPVIREDSATTRLRVVFNASCKTSNGTSLNDHLFSGPKLQEELSSVILRWRMGRLVYTADIEKMFRQILVHDSDRDYQRILWRPREDEPISSYQLTTVTYGTACAPYLSLRVLKQLTDDDGHHFPDAVPILRDCKYVDDLLFSGHNVDSMLSLFHDVNALLARGGFHLRKWASNSEELLQVVPQGEHELAIDRTLGDSDHDSLKILGLVWIPSKDKFKFKIVMSPMQSITKRSILSFIARLYDPLGWAAPVTVSAKIIMQDLWLSKVGWDDELPPEFLEQWSRYHSQFHVLSEISISRWTGYSPDISGLEVHGFADASSRAYSAVVYLRILHSLEDIQVCLLAAKTKVAPVQTISIPRLELSAAVLLTKLLEYVVTSLKLSSTPVYGWTDSTVVLAWLRQHPTRWSVFVANRVTEIQRRIPQARWNHVPTTSNPADCASRGITPDELHHHKLWWEGPPWLQLPSPSWPSQPQVSPATQDVARSEMRKVVVCQVSSPDEWIPLSQVSSWPKALRITAYLIRFVRFKFFKDVQTNVLTQSDLQKARNFLCRFVQNQSFREELNCIQRGLPIKSSSPLRSLNPFVDNNRLLRLGGRLRHAELPFERRFPIILPKHRITELLIGAMHVRTLHGGVQITLSVLRQHYWVIGARSAVRYHIHRCIPCVRERAEIPTQLMSDLPSTRVNPSPPFTHTGVDYAGPFSILLYCGRGQKLRKYYVAVFVCFTTKAVHLEYVEDCSTPEFLAALKRFSSRRGILTDMYSDNGTNFQGADRELKRLFHLVFEDPKLREQLRNEGTNWHFIPAIAPHFGGLWEAAVRSFKHHLRRVVGAHTLTVLEFSTLLCQIEACLNSRPLLPLRDDPSDLEVLTPGHFLIGRPLLCVPEPSLLEENVNRLKRWYRVQAMRDQFWKAWQTEYLQTLHQRHKWQKECPSIRSGELVLLRNNQLPPSKWDLARVTETHPGADGLVRVVTLRTAKSIVKRPITQVCRLPVSHDA